MISLHYTSHTKAYNTIYTACNIVEAIYSFTNTTLQLSSFNPYTDPIPLNSSVLTTQIGCIMICNKGNWYI